MTESENRPPDELPKEVLEPHKRKPWYPDTLGHREARRPGQKMSKNAEKQLEDRTEALKRELGLTDNSKEG